ncbi:MAG TPA: ATP-dependent metallopeptidase FtsH/Yme1/Tma family protein, partial [Ramlibacter sp.]|nr:ATP-dependent metallopeptidase FtsH/Yme1/Tma family protein [Ramlibacter sp.]
MPPAKGGLLPANMPPRKVWLFFLLILFVNYLVSTWLFPDPDRPLTVPYTVFRDQVAGNNVAAIYSSGTSIEGRFAAAVTWPPANAQA